MQVIKKANPATFKDIHRAIFTFSINVLSKSWEYSSRTNTFRLILFDCFITLVKNKKKRKTERQTEREADKQTNRQTEDRDTRRLVLKKTVFLRGRVR